MRSCVRLLTCVCSFLFRTWNPSKINSWVTQNASKYQKYDPIVSEIMLNIGISGDLYYYLFILIDTDKIRPKPRGFYFI